MKKVDIADLTEGQRNMNEDPFINSPSQEDEDRACRLAKEIEHSTVAIRGKDGGVESALVINKAGPYPAGSAEFRVHRLVEKLGSDDKPPALRMTTKKGRPAVDVQGYGSLLHLIGDFISLQMPGFTYSPYLEAFKAALTEAGVMEHGTFGPNFPVYADIYSPQAKVLFESLLLELQRHLKSYEFKHTKDSRRAKARRIERRFLKMRTRCLSLRSRIQIVRLDLAYARNGDLSDPHPLIKDRCPNEFSLDVFNRDRKRFISNIRQKRGRGELAEHLLEWGWKQEYGELSEWHLHCVFMYDANKVRNGWYYAMRAGELWVHLTNGRGSYFIPKSGDHTYASSCLGENRRDDKDEEAAKGWANYCRYLGMDDQMPVVMPSAKSQVFGINRFWRHKRGSSDSATFGKPKSTKKSEK